MRLLQGNKIVLRALEPDDIKLLMDWENDPSNWEVGGTLAPFSKSVLERYIKNSGQDIFEVGQQRFMIVDKTDQSTIGTLDLFDHDGFHQRAGVGILIGDPEKRKNGYALESLELIRNYCFDFLNLKQLYCNIAIDNEASLGLFQKAGFTISGTKSAWLKRGKEYKDEYFLQLINS